MIMNTFAKFFLLFTLLFNVALGDFNFKYTQEDKDLCPPMSEKDQLLAKLNVTTGGPYTYSQSGHHFYGVGYGLFHFLVPFVRFAFLKYLITVYIFSLSSQMVHT